MCIAQGHNTLTHVRFEPAAPRSRFKHAITEPLYSLHNFVHERGLIVCVCFFLIIIRLSNCPAQYHYILIIDKSMIDTFVFG